MQHSDISEIGNASINTDRISSLHLIFPLPIPQSDCKNSIKEIAERALEP
jgi:hypothetical protein